LVIKQPTFHIFSQNHAHKKKLINFGLDADIYLHCGEM